jgi:AcrR family transcriptional regulator
MWQQLLESRPRDDIRESTRARLLEAALVAFARHGYAEVSIDDLCRAVGIAKGSFYRYFESKAELFFAAATEAARRSVDTLAASAGGGDALLERIADAVLPWLCIVLDLAALASQRRAGHARALRSYLAEVHDAIAPELPELSSDELAEIVEVGVARAVRRVTSDSAALAVADASVTAAAGIALRP